MSVEDFRNALREEIAETFARIQNQFSVTEDDFATALYASAKKYLPQHFADANAELSGTAKIELKEYFASLNLDDLTLALACAKGDDQAWEDFFRDYRSYLVNISRTMTQDAGAAEQLADSTFAELYGLRESEGQRVSKFTFYSGRGSLRGWLRAVVFQLSADSHRQTSRFVQPEEPDDMEKLAHSAESPQNAPTTEIAFIRERYKTAAADALRRAIDGLDARERLLLVYYYYDELTLKEIAQMFEVHEATVSRWITKVQKHTRKLVEKSLTRDHNFNRQEVSEAIALAAEEMDISVREYLYEPSDREVDKTGSEAVVQN
ncbi:MAG: sigma-70 family RNA polymerase sigma factor [Acidobacteriota bacterium]